MKTMRLDKYLSTYAPMSRREAKAAVKKGRVSIDGKTAGSEDQKVTEGQTVCLDHVVVTASEYVYYMLNKPAGVVSATADRTERTVLDLMDVQGRQIFPVGRLDKDTEGLLILTDNGKLAHQLLSPKYHVEKVYEFVYEGELVADAAQCVAEGMDIGEKKQTLPAVLELLEKEDHRARLTLSEGKYHQVKRMVAKLGGHVTELRRISFGGIALDESLQPGEYRMLTGEEERCLWQRKNIMQ